MTDIVLRDPASGATAKIAPALGFNCYAFEAVVDSTRVNVLAADAEFPRGKLRSSGHGIPILFPFPNRIRNGRFTWAGSEYTLPTGDGRGNAIHGFVLDRAWRVVATSESSVTGRFQLSVDAPDRRALWPADFVIEVRYELAAASLRAEILIQNPDTVPLPWGFGTHPYFHATLAPQSTPKDCLVQVPATESWELADLLPTGRRLPVAGRNDLREGVSPADGPLDDVLTGLTARERMIEMVVMDARAGLQISQTTPDLFRECVVYTPPGRPAACLEPYTCVTDAINLHKRGIDAGWQVLLPGMEYRTWIEIRAGRVLA